MKTPPAKRCATPTASASSTTARTKVTSPRPNAPVNTVQIAEVLASDYLGK